MLSGVPLFATPWTAAHQAPLSMEFSRQEYWSGLPCPPPGDLPNPGAEPRSPALYVDSLPAEPPGKPENTGVGSLSLLQQISRPRNRARVSCVAGDSSAQNTKVDSLSLLQGIFPTQGSNPGLLHCRRILYHLSF